MPPPLISLAHSQSHRQPNCLTSHCCPKLSTVSHGRLSLYISQLSYSYGHKPASSRAQVQLSTLSTPFHPCRHRSHTVAQPSAPLNFLTQGLTTSLAPPHSPLFFFFFGFNSSQSCELLFVFMFVILKGKIIDLKFVFMVSVFIFVFVFVILG